MNLLVFLLLLLWVSFCFAKVEIAIEGGEGWAKNLPTWRLSEQHWVSRILFGGKPATGYHVWLEIFLVSFLHVVYAFVPFSWGIELQLLAFFCFFCVVEDFLWFALNPAFGIKNFRKEKIWWHSKNWWLIAPRDYYILLAIGALLYYFSFRA